MTRRLDQLRLQNHVGDKLTSKKMFHVALTKPLYMRKQPQEMGLLDPAHGSSADRRHKFVRSLRPKVTIEYGVTRSVVQDLRQKAILSPLEIHWETPKLFRAHFTLVCMGTERPFQSSHYVSVHLFGSLSPNPGHRAKIAD